MAVVQNKDPQTVGEWIVCGKLQFTGILGTSL